MAESGWFSDPSGRHQERYFDGESWTPYVATDGATSSGDEVDPSWIPPGLSPTARQGEPDFGFWENWGALIGILVFGFLSIGGWSTVTGWLDSASAGSETHATPPAGSDEQELKPALVELDTAGYDACSGYGGFIVLVRDNDALVTIEASLEWMNNFAAQSSVEGLRAAAQGVTSAFNSLSAKPIEDRIDADYDRLDQAMKKMDVLCANA